MTITDTDLDSAVQAGLLDASTAHALRAHAASRRSASAVPQEDEHFRLLSGFNDVFVVTALAVLLGALAVLVTGIANAGVAAAAVALAAWALAEYFVQRRRLALPAVLLSVVFAVAVGVAVGAALTGLAVKWNAPQTLLTASVAAALAAALHGVRFRVPIDGALVAAASGLALVTTVTWIWPDAVGSPWLHLPLAVGLLAVAIALDTTDPQRRTLRADVAFWLHLLAAPWLVHAVFITLLSADGGGALQAVATVVIYLLLAASALVLDRRALLISGLAYVLAAVAELIKSNSSGSASITFAAAALLVGGGLLLLAAGWQRARAPLVRRLPAAWAAKLPPA